MSDTSYRPSDDYISRRRSGYRSVNDSPAVREYKEYERKRKAASAARKAEAARKAA